MDLRPSVKTPPVKEPFELAEARLWAKVDHALDDPRIAALISRVRLAGEEYTGRAWITQTLVLKLDAWPAGRGELDLPRPPIQSVTSVKYYDVDGVLQTLAASEYFVRAGEDGGGVVLKPASSWPDLEDGRPNAIEVEYVAGYGLTADTIPGFYIEGASLLLVHLYENRTQEQTGTNVVPLIYGLEDLWSFRRVVPV